MLPNGKQRLFFSCFTVSSTSCRTGFTCFSTLSVRLLKLYSCFPTLSIGFIKSLQIIIFARKNTQPCHTVRRVSDLKSAQHKKSSSAATWIFCMEPICFGIIKGEQPLVCNGDDRGQRPKQGGAVGAAACRMRVPSKARSRRREPQPEHIQRKNYFYICKSGKSADFPDLLFHGEGRNDKWHLPARASCGSVRAAEKVQPCLDGLRWLLSTSPNFSAEIVRTAND